MNRGYNREVVFAGDEDHRYFLELLDRYRQRFAVKLHHYCLMSNHFHLLVQCAEPRELSAWMAGLLRAYVYYSHRRTGFVVYLWQGRFKSPAVAIEEYFLSCARYIERNPVAAGIAAEPWSYPWSSAAAYAVGPQLASPIRFWRTTSGTSSLAPTQGSVSSAGVNSCWALTRARKWSRTATGPSAAKPTAGGCSASKPAPIAAAAGRANRPPARKGFFHNSIAR